MTATLRLWKDFYPRPLRGGRLGCRWALSRASRFLSTPSARRATRLPPKISVVYAFLSTPSARRATWRTRSFSESPVNFYPRPLRGGRPGKVAALFGGQVISIHALCEEGDPFAGACPASHLRFLSTPSARRATGRHDHQGDRMEISIHALCEEGDALALDGREILRISIHALCEEGDGVSHVRGADQINFYPRPLRGGRLPCVTPALSVLHISIHALCEEGDSSAYPDPALQ